MSKTKSFKFSAIETSYKGCLFRSRLEARWATFFDEIGLLWEYKREGYELQGGRYLPDFWIPSKDSWIEIKGQEPTGEHMQKAKDLSLYTKKRVYLISGNIGFHGPQKTHRTWRIQPPWIEEIFFPSVAEKQSIERETSSEVLALLQRFREDELYLFAQCDRLYLEVEPYEVGYDLEHYLRLLQLQHKTLSDFLPLVEKHVSTMIKALTPHHGGKIYFRPQEIEDRLDWIECEGCKQINLDYTGYKHFECPKEKKGIQRNNTPRLVAAYNVARSARFEKKEP